MNALEQALFETLSSDPTIEALLPRSGAEDVYVDEAEENAPFPHVVFGEISGAPAYTFTERVWEEFIYQVKGVCKGDSAKVAQELAEAIDAVLSDGTFTIPGHTLMYSRKTSDMPPLTEPKDGSRYSHRGGRFEIWVGPES